MARINNLSDFLSDVAGAIRTKKGTSETILASDFDTEIENLPSGGGDLSEYFENAIDQTTISGSYGKVPSWQRAIKKMPSPMNISTFYSAFYEYKLTTLPQLVGTVPAGNNTSYMFYNASELTAIDLSNVDITNTASTSNMFFQCANLKTLNIGGINNNNLIDMRQMFTSCVQLTALDLSDVYTSNVINMSYMFNGCSALTKLDIRNFTFTNVTNSSSMFNGIPTNCEIIVKSQTEKDWVLAQRSNFTNVKTVAEYEAEQNA